MTIIDAHTHVASEDFIPRSFIEAGLDNIVSALSSFGVSRGRQRVLAMYIEMLQDPGCEQLLAEMSDAGIAKSVLLLPDFTYALPDCRLSIEEAYRKHHDLLRAHPDEFFVFAGVDPRWGADGVTLFERGVTQYGFHGLKLYPPCGYSPSDAALYPLYEICAARHLPVLVHIGPTSPILSFETARPICVDRAARDFPTVNFILAHGGTVYVEECVLMARYRPNVYIDISAFQAHPLGELNRVFESRINHKIIFGTDWPLFRLLGRQRPLVEGLLSPRGPLGSSRAAEVQDFFSSTILRLLDDASASRHGLADPRSEGSDA